MALAVVLMHLLGDVPSPVVVGAMLQNLPDPSLTMSIVTMWLGWCVVFWGAAFYFARKLARRLEQGALEDPLLLEGD